MNESAEDTWEIRGVRYGRRSDAKRYHYFLNDSNALTPLPVDYFFWILKNRSHTIVVDTGCSQQSAPRFALDNFIDPLAMLLRLGTDPKTVQSLIVTHSHPENVNLIPSFPSARISMQSADFAAASNVTEPYAFLREPYCVRDVELLGNCVEAKRVHFHDGGGVVAQGVTVHRIDGHSAGLQCVRVKTRRGFVVLASDAAPFFESFIDYRVSPAVVDVHKMLRGYDRLRELATSLDHIVPSHDALVSELYPEAEYPSTYRLDLEPARSIANM